MKTLTVFLSVMLLVAAGVSAQSAKPFSLYLGAGGSVPSGDFGSAYKFGYHAVGGVGLKMLPVVEFVPKVEFHTFSIDKSNYVGTIDGGSVRVLMFGGDVRYAFPLPAGGMKPFLLGGIGFASLSQSDLTLDGVLQPSPESTTKFYFNVGGGFEFSAGPIMNLFVQARYVSISTDLVKSNYVPVTVGIKF